MTDVFQKDEKVVKVHSEVVGIVYNYMTDFSESKEGSLFFKLPTSSLHQF